MRTNLFIIILFIVSVTAFAQNETFTVNGISFTMVHVAGGTFMMGADNSDDDAGADECPRHEVTLSDFKIGQTEVTQALWQAVMGNNPSYFCSRNGYTENPQRPVEWVSWNDCQKFIVKLNALTGKKFRLPTEAEWEYAARGGKKSKGYRFVGCDTPDELKDVAWWLGNTYDDIDSPNYGHRAVGMKKPNELGLFDMAGNVREWCLDWFGIYSNSPQHNPSGPSIGVERVVRGGSYNELFGIDMSRPSYRDWEEPEEQFDNLGFRLAL